MSTAELAITDIDRAMFEARLKSIPKDIQRKTRLKILKEAEQEKYNARQFHEAASRVLDGIKSAIKPARKKIEGLSFEPWQLRSKEQARKTAKEKAAAIYAGLVKLAENDKGSYQANLHYCFTEITATIKNLHPDITTPPAVTDEEKESALLRMRCEKWWNRKLQRLRRRHNEYLALSLGRVGKNSPYASREAVAEWVRGQVELKRWAEGLELESSEGDVIALEQALAAGMSNPENVRVELMKRIAGLEDYAEEMGCQGAFVTLTAPGACHRKTGDRLNPNWNGKSPKEVQDYMVKTWAKARAKLSREDIKYFGVRVAEPHKDGTPHWHVLLWAHPEELRHVKKVLFAYFTAEDAAELRKRWYNRHKAGVYRAYRKRLAIWRYYKSKGQDRRRPKLKDYLPWAPRFLWEPMRITKRDSEGKRANSAAAYIAKYISKNINGEGIHGMICEETGRIIDTTLAHVKAWSSVWGIRQFQFQGCDPITVYRELRRVRNEVSHKQLEMVREAAESDRFVDFIKAMKTVDCGLEWEETEQGNEYGETVRRVKGVVVGGFSQLTREITWTMRKKQGSDATGAGATGLPWPSGVNCTQYVTPAPRSEHQRQLERAGVQQVGLSPQLQRAGLDQSAVDLLSLGYTVSIEGTRHKMSRGQIYQKGATNEHIAA